MTTPVSSYQLLALTALKSVSSDRLQRAATILAENSLAVTLTRLSDADIRALVKNGEGSEYGVVIMDGAITCSCKDSLFRGVTCKHAVALALYALRTTQTEQFPQPRSWHVGDRVERNGHIGKVICVSGEYVSIQWDSGRITPMTRDELAT